MRSTRQGERGVTLIEMMVVCIVIALLVAVTTPSITAGLDSVRLATATSSVAAFINSAVTRAERRQRPVEIIISSEENTLRAVSTDPGSLRDLALPKGISLRPLAAVNTEDSEGTSRWLYMPGGAVPGVTLQLSNQHGSSRIIRLDPLTGFPRVEIVKKQ